jgi:hypothetical protein
VIDVEVSMWSGEELCVQFGGEYMRCEANVRVRCGGEYEVCVRFRGEYEVWR